MVTEMSRNESLLGQSGRGSTATRPQIMFSAVAASQDRILVKCAFVDDSGRRLGGDCDQETADIIKRFDSTVIGTNKTYVLGDRCWHYYIDANTGRWYICVAAREMGRRIPLGFLESLWQQFEARQFSTAQLQLPGLQRTQEEFGKEMQTLMEKFNDPSADRLTSMMEKVRNVNDNLMESLDKLLERGENISSLVHRTEELSASSNSFRRAARDMRNRAWWQEKKSIAIFILVLLCAIMLILFLVCGITFSQCRSE
mmetsp:Transcript_59860/g.118675  ORF Transcript_59860/g.118675 Transcript_59860/m.118675 type:complete len:256 (-) Transcript_59860:60-827(-)